MPRQMQHWLQKLDSQFLPVARQWLHQAQIRARIVAQFFSCKIDVFMQAGGGAVIERYVPALPLSREAQQYRRLLRTLAAYRLVLGQPRQDDLMRYVGKDVAWLQIDLAPPTTKASEL